MITFKEETHQYFDGDKELIPVTALLVKHGLAVNYEGIDKETLETAAARGRLVHKELENYVKYKTPSFIKEVKEFDDELNNRGWHALDAEFIVNNDICAGTCDLLLDVGIADHKTTSVLHKDALSWQLSIYNALMGYKYEHLYGFHFANGKKLKVVEVDQKPREEIERLFECERQGVLYSQRQVATTEQLKLLEKTSIIIARAEEMKKAAQAQMETVKQEIGKVMEEYGVKSFENEILKIVRCDTTEKVTIDTKRLKAENPDVAKQYEVKTQVQPYLRITLKEKV